MFIFHELKLIYVIVPATGSNSFHQPMRAKYKDFETVKRPASGHASWKIHPEIHLYNHFTAEQWRMVIDSEIWKTYTKFGFVRHPYSWARTMYRKGSAGVLNAVGIDSSGTFVEYLRKLEKTPYTWFTDSEGNKIIDRIYRTEDLPAISKEFGIECGHRNKTGGPKEAVKSEEVKQLLRQKFEREYKHYAKGDTYGS
jgi:hypothetical protein